MYEIVQVENKTGIWNMFVQPILYNVYVLPEMIWLLCPVTLLDKNITDRFGITGSCSMRCIAIFEMIHGPAS